MSVPRPEDLVAFRILEIEPFGNESFGYKLLTIAMAHGGRAPAVRLQALDVVVEYRSSFLDVVSLITGPQEELL